MVRKGKATNSTSLEQRAAIGGSERLNKMLWGPKNQIRKKGGKKLKILHFNCKGFVNVDRLYELGKASDKIEWDLIGLSEVRKRGEGLIKRKNRNLFYYYGEIKVYRGIGFYIKKKIKNNRR